MDSQPFVLDLKLLDALALIGVVGAQPFDLDESKRTVKWITARIRALQ